MMIKEALLYKVLSEKRVSCYLCSHRCQIGEGNSGICGVRKNRGGRLYTLVYAEPVALNIDPIEKKPLYHFLPGSFSYSLATVGCNFRCGFCQNWQISQLSRREGTILIEREVTPQQIVIQARSRCLSISYTYTEPTIFFEYAYDTARLARKAGLYNNFVTNGYMSREALDTIRPYLDAANVDLKSFNEDFYRKICKAHLRPVLESIVYMKKIGVWVEVTTLIIPGKNDSEEELTQIARFIAQVDKNIPWHVSRFHPDYQFRDTPSTPLQTLKRAAQIGKSQGLRYVYLGNVPEGLNTYCFNCGQLLVERSYFQTRKVKIKDGRCSECGVRIEGFWG